MNYIRTGRAPDEESFVKPPLSKNEQIVFDNASTSLKKEAIKYLKIGAIAVGGGIVATLLKMRYAGVAGIVIGTGWDIMKSELDQSLNRDVIVRFEIDEGRRKYLKQIGRGLYEAAK